MAVAIHCGTYSNTQNTPPGDRCERGQGSAANAKKKVRGR